MFLQERSVISESSFFSALANEYLNEVKPYVPGLTGLEASARYDIPLEKLIKLSSNENPLGPPPLAVKYATAKLLELHRYPDAKASLLRREIAEREGLKPENFIIGAGSSEIMSFIVRAFTQPGDEVVSMDPSFTVYSEIAVAEGRKSVFIPLNYPFDLALDDILSVLTDKTRLIFLTRPNNPTSRLIPLALLGSVLKMVKNAIIVADEAYIEFADNYRKQTAANLINQTGNLIVTRTFSKAYGIPNLRIGYALGPVDAIDYLFKIKPKWNVGEVAQQAAIGALKDQEHFRNVLEVVSEGREFLCKQLDSHPKLQVVPDPQGNFIMVNVSDTGYSSEAFADLLGTKGILIRGDFHPHYVRISIGTHFENLALIEAIKEVLD